MKKIIVVLLFSFLFIALSSLPDMTQAETDKEDPAKLSYLNRKRLEILKKIITKNLPRRIRVGAMDTFLFGLQGARIDRFLMTENAKFLKAHPGINPVFMTAESILVRISPLMLLVGQVFVDEMTVNSPRYQIIRDKEGNFNFDDLSEAQDSKLLKWLRVKKLTVTDGEYRVHDDSALDGPVEYTVDDVDVLVTDFTIGEVFNLDIKARSPGASAQNMSLAGKAGPMELNQKNEEIPINGDLTVKDLPIIPYLGYSFPKNSPAKPVSGLINIGYHLNGDAWSGMALTGGLQLSEVVLQSADGAMSGEPINMDMTLREPITLSLKNDLLEMKGLDLCINGNRFSLSGKMTNLNGLPRVDTRVFTEDLKIETMNASYPFLLRAFPEQVSFGGDLDMDVRLAGNQTDATIEGRMDLTDLTFRFADYFFKPPQEPLTMDFKARVNTSQILEAGGKFEMGRFELGHYNFIEDILNRLLANAANQKEKEKLLECYRHLPHAFEKITGELSYKDDQARISDIRIVNLAPEKRPGIDAVLNGMVNFSDNSLNIKGEIIISEELSRRILDIAPGSALYLSNGSIVLGFLHTGTIDKFDLEIFPAGIQLAQGETPETFVSAQ
ncbi:MAG: DUF748 domain-containing protein [Thermodesulfobacteriota bacterium]